MIAAHKYHPCVIIIIIIIIIASNTKETYQKWCYASLISYRHSLLSNLALN